MILGAQLFGVCYNSPLNTEETLKKIAGMGYNFIEPCVALDPIPGLEKAIWPIDVFESLYPKIKEMGLDIISVHFFAQNLAARANYIRDFCKQYGIRFIVVKTPQDMSILSLQKASIEYMTVADALAEVGAKLLIHNESGDIETKIGGTSAYEYLLDLCQGRVYAQVDVGWVHYAGEDEVALLKRNQYRVAAVHYKDFSDEKKAVVVGKGGVNIKACFAFARAYGFPHIVDQDVFSGDLFEEMQEVYQNMGMAGSIRNQKSFLNVMDIETGEVKVLASFDKVIEAPNWLKKTDELVFNSEGLIYAYSMQTGEIRKVETGDCVRCNNDHVLAADESAIAVSNTPVMKTGWGSYVYIIPFETGVPRQITPKSPSFLHGWSPDGKTLAYCAFREINGKREVDVYTIAADGSEEEVRLTGGGFNDGPEYSPDGEYIWYNSTNSGLMQIWRMKKDGSEQTQITKNEKNNWFAHISPDGKKAVYLAYHKGHLSPAEHLPDMQVELWLMESDGSNQHRILSFFGGQGSINVNSWAADSKRFAFVSYEME